MVSRPRIVPAFVALVPAFSVVISPLYHSLWIDAILQITLGGLVIGFEFLWSDHVCYAVGIAMG